MQIDVKPALKQGLRVVTDDTKHPVTSRLVRD